MKKKKPAKKKVPAKKKAKALKKSKPIKKKKVVKKAAAPKKKKVVKKAKAVKRAKPVKKTKATKKAKPKKAAVSKKAKAKKVASPKKAVAKKVKAVKKPAVKKPGVPKTKVSLPATPAVQDLQRQKAVFTLCSCQMADPWSIEQQAAQLKVDPHCIIQTLVMEDEVGKPMLVLMHGDQEVSPEELAATIGAQQITACNEELTEVHTGYERGAISPFGIQKVMPAFMEKSIAMMPEIYVGAGQRGLLAKMKPGELIEKLKPFMVSIAK